MKPQKLAKIPRKKKRGVSDLQLPSGKLTAGIPKKRRLMFLFVSVKLWLQLDLRNSKIFTSPEINDDDVGLAI